MKKIVLILLVLTTHVGLSQDYGFLIRTHIQGSAHANLLNIHVATDSPEVYPGIGYNATFQNEGNIYYDFVELNNNFNTATVHLYSHWISLSDPIDCTSDDTYTYTRNEFENNLVGYNTTDCNFRTFVYPIHIVEPSANEFCPDQEIVLKYGYHWQFSFDGLNWVNFPTSLNTKRVTSFTLTELFSLSGIPNSQWQNESNIKFQTGYGTEFTNVRNINIINCSPKLDGPVVDIQPTCSNSINTNDNNNGSFTVTFDRELDDTQNEKMNLQVYRQVGSVFDGYESKVLSKSDFTGRSYTWTPRNLPGGTYKLFWQTKSNNGVFDNIDTTPDAYDQSDPFTLTPPPALSVNGTPTPVQCFGGDDGRITVSASGGTPPYQYSIDGSTWQTSTLFDNLIKGDYTIHIKDNSGCQNSSSTITVIERFVSIPDVVGLSGLINNPTLVNGNNGRIVITVSGGSGNYTNYAWTKDGNPFTPPTGSTNTSLVSLYAGVYTIIVTDSNGCSSEVETFTLTDPDPIVVTINMTPNTLNCSYTQVNLTASATGGFLNSGGDYSYTWNTGATGATLTNVGIGTYQVTVTDQGGNNLSKSFEVQGPDPITATPIINNVSCKNGKDGNIQLNISGGTGVYTVNWTKLFDPSFSQSGVNIANLTAGSYEYVITDQNNCSINNFGTPIEITQPTIGIEVSEVTASHIDNIVFGGAIGVLEINVTNNQGTTSFDWYKNGAPFTPPAGSTNTRLINLEAGSYTVDVIDTNSCIAILAQPILITEPQLLEIGNIATTQVTCKDFADGKITVTVTGGISPYTYLWSKQGDPSFIRPDDPTIDSLEPGAYTVTVTDDSNVEISSGSINITQPDPLAISFTTTDILCYGEASGAIDITPSGGTPPYSYLWSNGETTQDITGASAIGYTVTVTDANNCNLTSTVITPSQPNAPISITQAAVTNLTGFQTGNGSIAVTTAGGTPGYTYQWRVQGTTPVIGTNPIINNLQAGSYQVTITDANNCSLITDYVVTQPDLLEVTNIQQDNAILCFGDQTATLTASVTGGVLPYTYRWYNVINSSITLATQPNIAGLGVGTYTIEITDANGNQANRTYAITEPPLLQAIYTNTDVSCNGGADGSINISVTGGTGSYSFFWSTGANTEDISGLSEGTYSVTVSDANLCQTDLTIQIKQPPAALTITNADITPASGNGLSNGNIEVSVSGGTSPYSYNWTNANNAPVGTNSNILSNLIAGSYFLTIIDAKNCSLGPVEYQVTEPDPLLVSISNTPISCFGEQGELFANVTGGVEPYSYQWFDAGNSPISTTSATGNIVSGTYRVVIVDKNNNQTEQNNIILTQPDQLDITNIDVTDVSCYNGNDGSIEISVTGGTGNYLYQWGTSISSINTHTNLIAGDYTVTVTDQNNCQVTSAIITVDQPVRYDIDSVSLIRPSNTGVSDGSISIQITGGASPYSYQWTDNTGTIILSQSNTNSISSSITNQPEGIYNILITDAIGCTLSNTYNLASPGELLVNIEQPQQISCFEGNDGILEVITTGGAGGNNYQWYKVNNNTLVGNTRILNGITAGEYYVVVSNADGISEQSAVFTVIQPLPVTANLIAAHPSCFMSNDGSITINAFGGNGVFEYRYRAINGSYNNWSPFLNTSATVINNLTDRQYQIQLRDTNGCTYQELGSIGTLSVTLNQPDLLVIDTALLSNPTGFGLTNGSITTTIAGGTTPYTYEWADVNGVLSETTAVLSGVGAGTYTLLVTDANDCTTSLPFTLTQPDQLIVSTEITSLILCNGDSNGSLRASATGGVQPYSYQWYLSGDTTPIAATNVLSNIAAGDYFVIVTDANNNTSQSSNITIGEPEMLAVDLTADYILCGGANNWSILSNVSGGTLPYTYLWDNENETTASLEDINPGMYTLTVQDSRGCTSQQSITLSPPDQLQITFTTTNPTCFEGNDGGIDLTTFGGTPPYTFNWDNGVTTEDNHALQASPYSLVITDSKGCSIFREFELFDPQELIIELGDDKTLCLGQTASFSALIDDPNATYQWTSQNGFSSKSPEITVSKTGTYTATVTNSKGCVGSSSVIVNQIDAEIKAEFLYASQVFTNEKFVVIDVTYPIPDHIEWIVPEQATILAKDQDLIELSFDKTGEYEITLVSKLGDCQDIFTQKVLVLEQENLGNESEEEPQEQLGNIREFNLYPNPSDGKFFAKVTLKEVNDISIKIFNLSNNTVLAQKKETGQKTYEIPFNLQVPSGVYAVVLETPYGNAIRKVIIK
ncbi:T9SS type A sorting domain-containing protein [Aquimarina sediminis]|uniref:T9SS type A sorting domain-containing protein n=1 Tax=Aquimarina sediminis TaxID=2070536 RepID=UPI000CA000D4|nr:T9SS type A sorting domain-containing protein [Aquimarina sediminis]